MLDYVIGHKTVAFFDIWSIEHVISGISFGFLALLHTQKKFSKVFAHYESDIAKGMDIHRTILTRFDLITVLFLAYAWETVEHYLEIGLLGDRVVYWFQGVEAWNNRFISDPLMLVLGYVIVRQYTHLTWPARAFSAVWLIVHIFFLPHSMYLQDTLANYFV